MKLVMVGGESKKSGWTDKILYCSCSSSLAPVCKPPGETCTELESLLDFHWPGINHQNNRQYSKITIKLTGFWFSAGYPWVLALPLKALQIELTGRTVRRRKGDFLWGFLTGLELPALLPARLLWNRTVLAWIWYSSETGRVQCAWILCS